MTGAGATWLPLPSCRLKAGRTRGNPKPVDWLANMQLHPARLSAAPCALPSEGCLEGLTGLLEMPAGDLEDDR